MYDETTRVVECDMRELARISDRERSARLLFAAELRAGSIDESALDRPEVADALTPWAVPPAPLRALQRVAMKLGAFDFERRNLAPLAAARRAVLGEAAAGPPRFLVRVDEFPLAGAFETSSRGIEDLDRFHTIMGEAGVPYLMAVSLGVAREYLDPAAVGTRPLTDPELEALGRLRDDGIEFGQHGFDHRTRDARPRHRSELVGLDGPELLRLLDDGRARLGEAGIDAKAFVPPFNRFEASQYDLLAERFEIVCGGPESVALFGYHRTPLWRGDAIYMPSYEPFYGRAGEVLAAAERAVEAQSGLWIPIVLHLGWEAGDGWADLERLARRLSGHARRWDELAQAV
jgi:hypothetical protein